MTNVLVIYASDGGHTATLASAVGEGARSQAHTRVEIKPVDLVVADDVVRADALIVGSPVHMSAMHWKIKRFIDEICGPLWTDDRMVGKVGGAFVTGGGSGGAGGGCDSAILGIVSNFAALGMFVVPLPKTIRNFQNGSLPWGAYARTEDETGRVCDIPQACLDVARQHGQAVARAAAVLRGNTIFAARATLENLDCADQAAPYDTADIAVRG